jgi:flavin reductase (DIM6/NTAB) family NADH-FMN oxidoreductase RutF
VINEEWLETLAGMVHGIYVLTSADGEIVNGMIASWVCQVSYEPPMVLVAVHPNRYSYQLIEKSGAFALHLITAKHRDHLSRFKKPDLEEKFSSIAWSKGKTGCPILKDCLGYLECIVRARYSPGNHTLFIGEIVNARMISTGTPMSTLDYAGFYTGEQ